MKKTSRLSIIGLLLTGLTFFGCFKWGARAFENFPKQTALDKSYSYEGKIIIIGAGAAGLAAAKILEKNNIDYQILEATDRYGGRLKKNETLADFPVDIGAEWIHNMPQVLNRLKGKKGEELDEELVPYRLENSYSWDGTNYKQISQNELDNLFEFFPEYKFKHSTWYDYVDANFATGVKHKIIYNSIVKEINYSGNKVIVKTENGKTHTADKVLVTVSIGVLKSNYITFIPDLSDEKQEAIDAVDFLSGFKLLLKFSQKFYPDVINCKTDEGEKAYYDVAFKKEAQSNILGLLSTGSSAKDYYQLETEEKIVSSVLEELDQIFDGKASRFYTGDYVFENWGQHQFTLGTWTNAALNKKFNLKALNQSLNRKVYFAGEIHDIHKQLGVPGAILSGYDAIDRLLNNEK